MHSGSTVIILVAIIFANAWTSAQSREGVPRPRKQIQVNFKLFPFPSNPTAQNILDLLNKFGSEGYAVQANLLTTVNGTGAFFFFFINIDNSTSPYHYRFFTLPTTSAELLKQANEQGAMGFRYISYLNASTISIFYVQDESRRSAKYTYRYGPCVSNRDELFDQINKNAAQGYRVLDSIPLGKSCVLYIRETSQSSQFVYKMVSNLNTTKDLLAKADQLGAQNYRYIGDAYINFASNGTSSASPVPLYYRDREKKGCTFSYSSVPVPDSPANLLALLQQQEAKGFFYATTFDTSKGSFLIFVEFHHCHHKNIYIEGYH